MSKKAGTKKAAHPAKGPRRHPGRRPDGNLRAAKRRFAARIAAGATGVAAVQAERPRQNRRTAAVTAVHWQNDPEVQADIAKFQRAALDYLQLDVNLYLEQLHAIATFDISDVFDDRGNVKPLSQIPRRARMAIQNVDVVLQNLTAGDGIVDEVARVRSAPKLPAIELLLKAHGKLVQRTERGKPGEFDKMDRDQVQAEAEKLAAASGLRLVKK